MEKFSYIDAYKIVDEFTGEEINIVDSYQEALKIKSEFDDHCFIEETTVPNNFFNQIKNKEMEE